MIHKKSALKYFLLFASTLLLAITWNAAVVFAAQDDQNVTLIPGADIMEGWVDAESIGDPQSLLASDDVSGAQGLSSTGIMSPPPTTGGSTVGGKCCYSSGPMASPFDVQMAAAWTAKVTIQEITQQIIDGFTDNIQAIKKASKAQQKSVEQLMTTTRDIAVEQGSAEGELKAYFEFGELAESFLPCDELCMPEIVQKSKRTIEDVVQGVREKVIDHSKLWDNSAEVLEDILQQKPESFSAVSVFPETGTIPTSALQQAKDFVVNVTNPLPSVLLPESISDGSIHKDRYDSLIKLKQAMLAVPQQVFIENVARHTPTMETSGWLENVAGGMNISVENIAGPEVSNGGKVSLMTYLKLTSEIYNASPEYAEHLETRNEKGVLKELVHIESRRLMHDELQTRLLSQIAVMLAQQTAGQANEKFNAAILEIVNVAQSATN